MLEHLHFIDSIINHTIASIVHIPHLFVIIICPFNYPQWDKNLNVFFFLLQEIKDFDTYIFNLTEANLHPTESPRWYKLYSFLEAYDVPSLKPHDLSNLVDRLAMDRKLRDMYRRYCLLYTSRCV